MTTTVERFKIKGGGDALIGDVGGQDLWVLVEAYHRSLPLKRENENIGLTKTHNGDCSQRVVAIIVTISFLYSSLVE